MTQGTRLPRKIVETAKPISKWLGFAVLIALLVVSLLTAVGLVWRVCCDAPPVQVTSLDEGVPRGDFCPGDSFPIRSHLKIKGTTHIFVYASVMDEGTNYNINGTQTSYGARPHPHVSEFTQTLPWTVPDLRPGTYARVATFRGHDPTQMAVHLITKFKVGLHCELH
jgi:hypothetical protein